MRYLIIILAGMLTGPVLGDGHGGPISIPAFKDNTLYESATGHLANGAGTFLFAGRTGQSSGATRRTLLSFDLSNVPRQAMITRAELSLNMNKTIDFEPSSTSLHRLLRDWSEGDTDASSVGEGQGVATIARDATWLHRSSPDELWTAPGGDFEPLPSAVIEIAGEGTYRFGTVGELLEDVQAWLEFPETNFGWIIIGDETRSRTAKRFEGRLGEEQPPRLVIDWEVPQSCNGKLLLGDVDGDGIVAFPDFLILSANFGKDVEGYLDGDLDCDGTVRFADFLVLSSNFGKSAIGSTSVPEPKPGILMLVAITFFATRRRLPHVI